MPTLIIVHTNDRHNPDGVAVSNIQALIDSQKATAIFEHMAYHSSQVSHQGTVIDDEKHPGYYEIPELQDQEFILVGGGIGHCHYLAFQSLLQQRQGLPTTIHLPSNCLYETRKIRGIKRDTLQSFEVMPTHQELRNYGPLQPHTSIHIWDTHEQMELSRL